MTFAHTISTCYTDIFNLSLTKLFILTFLIVIPDDIVTPQDEPHHTTICQCKKVYLTLKQKENSKADKQ